MKSGSRGCSGGHQHRQHQDGGQRCPVRDRSHHPRHQIREWPQGERAAHPISGSSRRQHGGLNPFFVTSPQVLAVNILGRFLLNNDRNIRSVPPSLPLGILASLSISHGGSETVSHLRQLRYQLKLVKHLLWSWTRRSPPVKAHLLFRLCLFSSGSIEASNRFPGALRLHCYRANNRACLVFSCRPSLNVRLSDSQWD